MKGFTLIEILLVIGIMALLAFLTLSFGIGFYRIQQLDTAADGIIQVLRQAHQKAMAGELDSDFGVRLAPGQYTLFAVNDPSYDENFDIDDNIDFKGISEVVFSRLTGQPSAAGNIILISGNEKLAVNINEIAVISLKLPVIQAVILRPNSQGNETGLNLEEPIGSQHWTCVDEEIVDDVDYVSNWQKDSWLRDLYQIEDYSDSDLIDYIEIHLRVIGGIFNNNYSGWLSPSLRTYNTTIDSQEINLADYGTGQDLPWLDFSQSWLTNPLTNQDWTWSEINDLEIGARLRCAGKKDYYVNLSQIYLIVNYTSFE